MVHILTDQIILYYFQIFSFLIQIKHQKRVLGSIWKELRAESRNGNLPIDLVKDFLLVRGFADMVLTVYESYIYHFCIERSWSRLRKSLEQAHTFNRVSSVHNEYILSIIKFSFFGGFQSKEFQYVSKFMNSISDFTNIVSLLF